MVAEPFVESELLSVAHQLLGALSHLCSAVVGGAADGGGGQTPVGHGPRRSLHHVGLLLLHSHLLHTGLLHTRLLHALLLHSCVGDVDVHRRILCLLHSSLSVHGGAHNFLPDGLARVDRPLDYAATTSQTGHTLHGATT